MATYLGRVSEVRLGSGGWLEALITCPPGAAPPPGRYLSAHAPADVDTPLGTPLFLAQVTQAGFWAAPPFSPSWIPGTELVLRGPLGTGFTLPAEVTRLALAALGDTPTRLLPLALEALRRDCAVTLYTAAALPDLPATLEIYPLDALRESLSWSDLLALDLPLERLPELRQLLGLHPGDPLPCDAQALIWTAMPCAGVGDCGACAIPSHRGHKLACADGPVFPLHTLEW
jgi:hypothetical protein